jgi:hypothetical protein
MYMNTDHIYMVHSPCFPVSLCSFLFLPLFLFPLTWNPPSCDRICPPRSQVACKLTSPDPPFPQTLPLPNSRNPITQRLTKTTSGRIRRLLSGTGVMSLPRRTVQRAPLRMRETQRMMPITRRMVPVAQGAQQKNAKSLQVMAIALRMIPVAERSLQKLSG